MTTLITHTDHHTDLDTDAHKNTDAGTGRWLDLPLSPRWCILGWVAAIGVLVAVVRLMGGISQSDVAQSVYSTWAIAHGHLSCAYYPKYQAGVPYIAPLYPLLSGGLAALTRIGHLVPFPSQSALGPNCSHALMAEFHWSIKSGAPLPTYLLGYVGGLALMAGVVAFLRGTGRGRCVREPVVLILLACVPTVWTPLVQYFHPQDLLAMGLSLAALACVWRGWWIGAGIFLGLAVTSQPFTLLVLAPLVVVAPMDRRVRFTGAAVAAAALVDVPVLVATSGRALGVVVFGSGNSHSPGGAVLSELHLHGALLVAMCRVLPIVLSVALAWWVLRRLGPSIREPLPLMSLIATSLSLRLVFEQTLFAYYFMALAISLILLYVLRGRIRGELVAWLALVTLAFEPVRWKLGIAKNFPWGFQEREFLPFIGMAVVVGLIVRDARRGRVRRYLVVWLSVVVIAFARLPWENPPIRESLPIWFWQIVLVPSGVALAIGPLVAALRNRGGSQFDQLDEQRLLTHRSVRVNTAP